MKTAGGDIMMKFRVSSIIITIIMFIIFLNAGFTAERFVDFYGSASGLEIVKNNDLDFILLDVMMEEVDTGCKMAQDIASLKPETPIVILSSFADAAQQMFDTSALPVKEYLQKRISHYS